MRITTGATIASLAILVGCSSNGISPPSGATTTTTANGDIPADITPADPIANGVFQEEGGVVSIEAEHYHDMLNAIDAQWELTDATTIPNSIEEQAPDGSHTLGSSGGAYLEALPDVGINNQDDGNAGPILAYNVNFAEAGTCYCSIRLYSSNADNDNSVNIGLSGSFPNTGIQISTQRTLEWSWAYVYGGGNNLNLRCALDIPAPGEYQVMISMREDGAELDKFVCSRDEGFMEGEGPPESAQAPSTGNAAPVPADDPEDTDIPENG